MNIVRTQNIVYIYITNLDKDIQAENSQKNYVH